MAVSDPGFKQWEDWKREMEETRRSRWRERVTHWAEGQVSDDYEEEESTDSLEEEGEDKVETEATEMGEGEEDEEINVREAQEIDSGEGERVEEIKKGDETEIEEEEEDKQGQENKIVEDERENDIKEATEITDEEQKVLNEEVGEKKDLENEVKIKVKDEGVMDEVEEEDADDEREEISEQKEDTEADTMGKEEEEEEMKEEEEEQTMRGIKGNEEIHNERKETDELKEEEEKETERVKNKTEKDDEKEDSDMVEASEMDDAQVNREHEVEKKNEQDEHEEQEKPGRYWQAMHVREQLRRSDDENIWQNQGGARQEDKSDNKEEAMPDLVELHDENSELMRSEDEFSNCEIVNEEKDDKEQFHHFTGQENPCEGDSWTTQDELQDVEEDSTDDEEADDVDDYGENVLKIYCKEDFLTDLFTTLKRFRDSSVLTDLTLSTDDGTVFHVHSLVMAAVSFRVRESMGIENGSVDERKHGGVNKWSISLGPEVDRVGLEAVVEFAYTGLMTCLSTDTLHQIKAAAETLRAPRVLEHCAIKEDNPTKTGWQKTEDRKTAEKEMVTSFQAIKQLWTDRVGCDVTLEAIGGSLQVHRVILAVWSDYFHSMFTLGMKESHQPSVTLPFLLASELEVLIDCSYSGLLPLSWKCVFEISSTSLQLQFGSVLSLCLKFLQQEINPLSCLDVASFAEAYEMTQLLEVADDFVLRQFQKVACTSKFTDLPAEKILRYLNSHSLCVSSELVVFKAVVAWIQAKPKKRMELAKELMKTIHFPLMTFKEFKEVQSQNILSDLHLTELFQEIFDDFCANETAPQNQCRIYLPKESLVLIGGDQTSEDLSSRSISRELWFGNSLRNHTGIKKAMEWRQLGEMPDTPRFGHEVAVLKGQLYVFGGKKYYGTNDTLNSVYRYDPLQNIWESLAPMQERRCYFSVVVLDGKIYAIGGLCDPDYTETVEQYCPITNSWRYTSPIYLPQRAHAARVLQGKIFVSGGQISDTHCLSSMFQYHPETGSAYLADMAKPRANHCMEILGECLYVAGGVTMGHIINILDLLSCEVYNPVTNCWSAFPSLPVPHVGAGSTVLEGKFYVLGGYSHEEYSDTTMIHRYDPHTQRWENMGKTPGPNNDIRATLLCLPTHFRL
ncbi:kelch-like protein 9 [Antennarius striatus]|uniref:kelch-like protein 9 n=1 Tax=Antennarius striatus TaxID=241820 RepID=UPI0035B1D918